MPEKAKLERVLMGLFCSEISVMSLKPLKAKALISVMLLESKLSFFKCLNLEKAEIKELESGTVFENHRKSLIQHCERSELRLHLEWTKVNQKCQK